MTVPVKGLKVDPENARLHPERNLEVVKLSLERFGQQKPIVVAADGIVLAGNGLLEAARALGWTHIAATKSDLSGLDRRAYAIADNKTGELSEWNYERLAAQLKDLGGAVPGGDLGFIGFSAEELAVLDLRIGDGTDLSPDKLWEGMPEFKHEDQTSVKQIIVHFKTLEDLAAFSKLVKQPLTERTRSIWFPKAEIGTIADKRYADEP